MLSIKPSEIKVSKTITNSFTANSTVVPSYSYQAHTSLKLYVPNIAESIHSGVGGGYTS